MTDLWTHLKTAEKPIVLYGTGDGADKILDVLDSKGIKADAIFASDGFVRKRTFRGLDVMSYVDVTKIYDDFIVLVAFGSKKEDVIKRIYSIAAARETYIPDVPAYGDDLFDIEYYEAHKNRIVEAREVFKDEESKELFDNIISYKLTGKPSLLMKNVTDKEHPFTDILHPKYYRNTFDLGAYNGDTALELCFYIQPDCIINAVEPNKKTFTKLCFNTAKRANINPILAAAWNERTVLTVNIAKGRGASLSKGRKVQTAEVIAERLDDMAGGEKVDYIKYDVEGAEKQALEGSKKTIALWSPELRVSVYHRSEDIFELPLLVKQMNPEYDLYLRRTLCLPAWEIDLYAVKRGNE